MLLMTGDKGGKAKIKKERDAGDCRDVYERVWQKQRIIFTGNARLVPNNNVSPLVDS